MSSTSITGDEKQNVSEIFGIAVSVRKVNQNSRGSETYCQKKKRHLFVVAQNQVMCNAREMMVVYHLHGKTGWSTVCTNGKKNSPMKNFGQDWRVPFAQPPTK